MKVIITGGAGFIGSNAAARYLARGLEVVIIDNLHRPGTASNFEWIRRHGPVQLAQVDIRDGESIAQTFQNNRDATLVLHLAGQVAVTSSVANPRADFEINALGTINVLEAMRLASMDAALIYASTNKVYGDLNDLKAVERTRRWELQDLPDGIPEERGIDFHSPYGCSKGAADQYVRDYHRIYGLNTVVLRQSCIYGTRQFGHEDQGWIAWFVIAAALGFPLTIYGDGKQVRDVLFVEDLLDVYDIAASRIESARGKIFNVGGGPRNAISLIDLLEMLSRKLGRRIDHRVAERRPGDQRIYISDIRRAKQELGWEPRIDWRDGVERLVEWVAANRDECRNAFESKAAEHRESSAV
ncbi:MAG: GDP-mannose 4,6-dehydratase [Candidatus Binatus sp.]|uniref:GDP-mannose 4,6-dehydratase n=1 Tax=Candidatus Binatus sp. TaxID=2811406 RepID=UPI00272702D0|nr:GDP-mannose 4,6-dehydratase [Candidatus Binatus sp.]MDO8431586.1 GDP-mannose 4,6-dehydratase [Candidatus Binatus sp.]